VRTIDSRWIGYPTSWTSPIEGQLIAIASGIGRNKIPTGDKTVFSFEIYIQNQE
jgi:hypothetical protein